MEELMTLLREKDTPAIIKLIESNPGLLEFKGGNGASLLLLSVYFGNDELTQFIADRKKEWTIFEATACGMIDMVKQILEKEPQLIDAYATDGFTPLGLASFFKHEALAEFLLQAGANPSLPSNNAFKVAPLHSAAASKNVKIAKLLIDAGADVNAKQQEGITPLHSAAHNGDLEMAELLLKSGSKKYQTTEKGKMPYDYAAEIGHVELMKLLG
jgi:ankyrin repeat protein